MAKKAKRDDPAEAAADRCRARRDASAPAPARRVAGKAGGKPKAGGKATKPPAVFNCRGCCCGTRKKHPGVDSGLLSKLLKEGAKEAGARYRKTDCLGPCGQGNIVVVRADGHTRWFRRMDDEDATLALMDHLVDTGTVTDLPAELRRRVMAKREGRKPKD